MIGDVVGAAGCRCIQENLFRIRKEFSADAVIVNGENSAVGNGMLPASADLLFGSGADIVTGGNHSFRRREIYAYLEEKPGCLRPANVPEACPGTGFYILDMGKRRLAVINLIGQAYMDPNGCPFAAAEQLLKKADTPFVLVDFHAESSGEKGAMGYFLDGRVSLVAGTHTHVQTADEQILPGGTGFITDIGMVGPVHSVLGIKPELIVRKMTTHCPVRFEEGTGPCRFNGIFAELDDQTGKCLEIQRIHRFFK